MAVHSTGITVENAKGKKPSAEDKKRMCGKPNKDRINIFIVGSSPHSELRCSIPSCTPQCIVGIIKKSTG